MSQTDRALSQIVGKLLHHRELKALTPRNVECPSGANIELSHGRDRAFIVMAPWQDGIGWALISKGKLYGEGKFAIGGDINAAIRPLMEALQVFEGEGSRSLFA